MLALFKKLCAKCDTPIKRITFIAFVASLVIYSAICLGFIIWVFATARRFDPQMLLVLAAPVVIPCVMILECEDFADFLMLIPVLFFCITIIFAPLCIQFDILGRLYTKLRRIKSWIATGK